jgi:hypothetical protein
VLWAGYALAGLVLAWLLTEKPLVGIACALLGGLYSAVSILAPGFMPKLEMKGLPQAPEAVVRWSHRILGAAGIPLWIAAWRGHVPHVPSDILMPVGVGVGVAIAAELMTHRAGRRQDRRP